MSPCRGAHSGPRPLRPAATDGPARGWWCLSPVSWLPEVRPRVREVQPGRASDPLPSRPLGEAAPEKPSHSGRPAAAGAYSAGGGAKRSGASSGIVGSGIVGSRQRAAILSYFFFSCLTRCCWYRAESAITGAARETGVGAALRGGAVPAGTGEQQEVRRDSGRCAEAVGGAGQQRKQPQNF